MPPDLSPPPPAVVAVLVACDPGPWFEETLASLAAQDYPNLSVLIVDAGSHQDPTPLVARVLPHAYVRRLDRRTGFAAAANEALSAVEGASHLLFCHDDVALAPDAIRLLLEEAFRSNAGIASPKLVDWHEPDRLLAVGLTTDKVGVLRGMVDPGELDQEQHDAVREVLVAPAGATLVRADLFSVLGGYDPDMEEFGEDRDLSWRARVAGARVMVVPSARVRHLQALRRGERRGWAKAHNRRRGELKAETARIKTLVKCYRWFDLAWILPLAAVWLLGEATTRALQGRGGEAWQILAAPAAAFSRPGDLWRARRRLQRHRTTGDAVLRKLQVRGNARLRAFVRSRVDDVRAGLPYAALPARLGRTVYEAYEDETVPEVVRDEHPVRERKRLNSLLVGAILAILLIGSRSLFGHELPAVGTIPNPSAGWSTLWRNWWSLWQPGGLGVGAQSNPVLALLGLLATALLGAVGTLQHVVVLGPLFVGPWGAYRAARWWGSRRGQVVALVAYAVVPLAYNDLARGHWDGLIAYGAAPWVVSIIGRSSGEVPFPSAGIFGARYRVVGLGLLVAAAGAVAPSFLYVVAWTGAALLAGSALAGRPGAGLRMFTLSLCGALVAWVLLFPWSVSVFLGGTAVTGPDYGAAGRLGLGRILRFDNGPFGSGWWGWALLAVAAVPLLIGRDWRLAWAARMWTVTLACFALAWAAGRGWVSPLPTGVVLAMAAAGLAGSAALGVAAFEMDLPGYAFGWRQLVPPLAAVALTLSSWPLLSASAGGRWHLPRNDASSVLAFLPDSQSGDYRVLWVGAPDALPLASRQLHPGTGYATSYDGLPRLPELWLTGSAGAAPELAADLKLVEARMTTKVGHLLLPAAVRYIVVPNHNGPNGSGAATEPVPNALLAGLSLQTDLFLRNVGDPNYRVFENSAWVAARAQFPPAAAAVAATPGLAGQRLVQQFDRTGVVPALTTGRGSLTPGSTLYAAYTRSSAWKLDVGGTHVAPKPAFGWAMSFAIPPSAAVSESRLRYTPPFLWRVGQILDILFWAAAAVLVGRGFRSRRRASSASEVSDPAWFVPASPDGATPERPRRRRKRPAHQSSGGDLSGEEVWSDV